MYFPISIFLFSLGLKIIKIEAELHYTKVYYTNTTKCEIIGHEVLEKTHAVLDEMHPEEAYQAITSIAERQHDHLNLIQSTIPNIREFFSHDMSILKSLSIHCDPTPSLSEQNEKSPKIQKIQKIFGSGKSSNRIDVTFMGDGYTEQEGAKFFSDIKRLVNETFPTGTFREFLPLLNIWAIFTPSPQSGISYPSRPRNTVFKLYRPSSTNLRGIFIKNIQAARRVCAQIGKSGCDYPVIIGNDEFYGGIGGEFAVSTSSRTSGSAVLRHELGHNFGRVGEEYDNGGSYSGVNTASNLKQLKWSHWLSNGTGREERIVPRILKFPLNDLKKKAVTFNFKSDGSYHGWMMFASLSGAGDEDSVEVSLDGQILPWKTKRTMDKQSQSWSNYTHGLSRGWHTLRISAPTNRINNSTKQKEILFSTIASEGIKIPLALGSVFFYEIGDFSEFQTSNEVISAYPTWSNTGRKMYRPTNNGCLMRNMSHDQLCSVCKESVWLQFLKRVSLIDELTIANGDDNSTKIVTVRILNLGQYRVGEKVVGERVDVLWKKNGKIMFANVLSIKADKGDWQVQTNFISPRIRKDPNRFGEDTKSFVIR